MPYSKLSEANPAVKGIKPKVTLGQANVISKWADAMGEAEDGPESPWAAAIAQFKKLYKKSGGGWMKKAAANALQFASNQTAEVRHEMIGDTEYLVAPVVAICEGVLKDELVPAREIGNHFHSWDGRPVVLGHPEEGDISISANDPGILHEIGIGWLYNTEFVDGKLKGEMWHPVTTLERIAPEYKERLEAGEETEVSTAYYRDRKEQPGKFGEVEYAAVAMNLHPDHLAVLLDVEGACSWQDGCGAPRVNEERDTRVNKVTGAIKVVLSALGLDRLLSNEESFSERDERIKQAWHKIHDDKDNMMWPDIKVYDDYIIVDQIPNGIKGFYQYNYQEVNGGIVFDKPFEVEVTYKQKGGVTNMDKKQMVTSIVEDERLDLSEEQLAESSEDVLTAIVGLLDKPELETQEPPPGDGGEGPEANEGDETPCDQELSPELTALMKAVKDRGGPDKVFSLLDGISANQDAHKSGLVEALAANSACAFNKDQLSRMDVDTLETLQQSLSPADYSGRGGGPVLNVKDITPLVMPNIFAKQEAN